MGKMEAAEQTGSLEPSQNSQALTVSLRELSKELQLGWIERLFGRLASLYGSAFGRQWDGTNLAEVKATWAEKLGGFTAPQIGEALKACEELVSPDGRSYPPNLPEFIRMCRTAAKRMGTVQSLSAPTLSREEAEERLNQVAKAIEKPKGYDYLAWAKELRIRYLAGETLLPIQERMAAEAMNEVWKDRQCQPAYEDAA